MLQEQQSRLVTVLVRARNPANIGAVARAMHDLGYDDLRVVNDFHAPFEAAQLEAAQKAAVHSEDILAGAAQHETLAGAIADCTLVLGTSAVGSRVLEHPLYTLTEAVPLVQAHLGAAPSARVALLFGSEKTGLTNEELSHCHALVTIPMQQRAGGGHLSMNLGQAAAVCLYTLAQEVQEVLIAELLPSVTGSEPASSAEEERLSTLLLELLERSGYTRRNPANAREAVMRRLVRRMGNSSADAAVWSGILRQVLRMVTGEATADSLQE